MNYNDLFYEYYAFYNLHKKKIQHNDENEHKDVIFHYFELFPAVLPCFAMFHVISCSNFLPLQGSFTNI